MEVMQQLLNQNKIDLYYISDQMSIEYLSGFKGTFGVMIISPTTSYLFTDERYLLEAQKSVLPHIQVLSISSPFYDELLNQAKSALFEGRTLSYQRFQKLQSKFPDIQWKDADNQEEIRYFRQFKQENEIQKIRQGLQIAEKAVNEVIFSLKLGQTELETVWQLEQSIRAQGSEALAFWPIVAFGKNSAIPHHDPDQTKLQSGDLVMIDFGAKYQSYHSDFTRCFAYQKASPEVSNIHEIVKTAQSLGEKNIQIGRSGQSADQIVRDFFQKQDLESYFCHGLGHGLGLEIHELPKLSPKSTDILAENQVVTCEPGLYFPEKFGIRLENCGIITSSGFQAFNQMSMDLQIIE